MKTIPVSLIIAGFLAPAASFAQPDGEARRNPQRGSEGNRGGRPAFMEAWKSVDRDGDGSISREEFNGIPRIGGLPAEKRLELFKRLDKNHDSKLDREELQRMGRSRDGKRPPMQRLWELDADKSGGVSFSEFKAGRIFAKLAPEKQEAVFRRLDTDGDGVISPKDRPEPRFKREGKSPRPKRGPDGKPDGARMEPRQMIRQLDQNGDGALSFEEFRVGPAVRNLTEDEQEDRFEALDKNQDLKISAKDFQPPPPRGGPRPPKAPPAAAE